MSCATVVVLHRHCSMLVLSVSFSPLSFILCGVDCVMNCWGLNRALVGSVESSPNSYFELFDGISTLARPRSYYSLDRFFSRSLLLSVLHFCPYGVLFDLDAK